MNCDRLTNDVLMDLSEQKLAEGARESVQAHLLDCAGCRRRFEEISDIAASIRRCAEPSPAQMKDLDAAVLGMLSRPAARPRRRGWIAAGSVAAAVMAAIVGYVALMPRTPIPTWTAAPPPRRDLAQAPHGATLVSKFDAPEMNAVPPRDVTGEIARTLRDVVTRVVIPALRGDLNGDRVIDVADRMILARRLARGEAGREDDLNGDGAADVADLQVLTREIARAQ